MDCVACGSAAVTERPECTARGYRRFRCRGCGQQSNERTGTALNRAHYPADVIALVVLWRLRYQLSLRDLAEMFLARGLVFSQRRSGLGGQAGARSGRGTAPPAPRPYRQELVRRRDLPARRRALVLPVPGG